MKYFPLLYKLDAEERYLLWISNDDDHVATDPDGHVVTFKDPSEVQVYAILNHYELEREEPVLHNLDWVAGWLKAPGTPVDSKKALAAWNLFSDTARSLRESDSAFGRVDKQFPSIYEKLFWGSNLPAMTPRDRHYTPEWSPEELTSIAQVLHTGLKMFRSHVRPFQQES